MSRADRARRTRELLSAAHSSADPRTQKLLLDEVVLLNRGVASAVAARYRGRGVCDEDLQQTALEGLIKAVFKFDPSVRPELLTYAVPTIRGEVQRYFRDHGWMVRPPRRTQELQYSIGRSRPRLAAELGREPSDDEVAADLGCTREDIEAALQAFGAFAVMSLDRGFTDNGQTLAETLAESGDVAVASEARLILAPVLKDLTDRQRRIIYLRFFEEKTQNEIGEEMGISQMQVSRLVSKILRNLRARIDFPSVAT